MAARGLNIFNSQCRPMQADNLNLKESQQDDAEQESKGPLPNGFPMESRYQRAISDCQTGEE